MPLVLRKAIDKSKLLNKRLTITKLLGRLLQRFILQLSLTEDSAMGCHRTTTTWTQNLKVVPESREYTVQLVRDIGCVREEYRIYVNGQEMDHHTLTYNPCSPLCCGGGEFEWEQDGHAFLLMFNSLSIP